MTETREAQTGGSWLILIVEDDPKSMKLTRDVLRFHGFRTLEATSAEAAMAIAPEHLPHLILLDIALPGIDGVAATKQLKGQASTASIPIVALTASAMRADSARFREAGFAGTITKPIDVATFPFNVLRYCEGAEAST